MASQERKQAGYHLPFFCPKDLDKATFYGVNNGKYIYKCKICKRAFSDADAIGANNEEKEDQEMDTYTSPNDGESSSASALLMRKNAEQNSISKKAKQNLRDAAIKLEKSRYVSVMKKLDRYGGGLDSPQFRPKTVMGGIISLVFIGAMLGIITMNIFKLAQGQRNIVNQGNIQITHYPASFKAYGILPISNGSEMDFPVMNLEITNNIIFFNLDSPPVQKVKVVDNTHFNPVWDTHNADPPTARSVYTVVATPYNSITDPLFPGGHSSRDIDMDTVWKESLREFYNQDMESLQLLEMEAEYTTKQFFPHDAWLFIRFDINQMAEILPYQVDISLVNGGEVEVFQGPDPLNNTWMENLSTLVKTDVTWNFTSDMQWSYYGFNLLELQGSLYSLDSYEDMLTNNTNSFLNWRFIIYYTSNFNYTNPDQWFCLHHAKNGTILSENFGERWANVTNYAKAPSASDKIITLVQGEILFEGPFPAEIFIWNLQIIEKMTLLDVSEDRKTLFVERHRPVDFTVFGSQRECTSSVLPIIGTHTTIPPAWTCPDDWYFDGWCDCGCGIADPTCVMCKTNCTGDDDYGHLNKYEGKLVVVGFPCEKLLIPGDPYLRGYYGSEAQFRNATKHHPIGQCPWDYYYNQEPNMDDNGVIICNATAENYLFVNETQSHFLYVSIPQFPEEEFQSVLDLGAQQIFLNTTVYGDQYVEFDGASPYLTYTLDCPIEGALQVIALGLLVSPLVFGSQQLWFLPCNENRELNATYFFPPPGPYIIADPTLQNPPLYVDSANCPYDWDDASNYDRNYHEQKVLLSQSPDAADMLNLGGTVSYMNSSVHPNTTTIVVYSDNYQYGSLLACCRESVYVVVGDTEVAKVVSVEQLNVYGEWVEPTCDDACFAIDTAYEKLTLELPLRGFYPIGAKVSSFLSNWCDYSSQACTFNNLYALVADFQTVRLPGEDDYQPEMRAMSQPPTELDVDVALFVVPKRNDFTSLLELCVPPENDAPQPQADSKGWQLNPDRVVYVTACGLSSPPDTTELCQTINCSSLDRMPPTTGFKFSDILPLNEKWVRPTDPAALLNTPEYYMDISSVYYFDYDSLDLTIGRKFAQNEMHDGDVNQYGETRKFSGEMLFIGRGNATDSEAAYYPAPAPVFFMNLTLYADKNLTNNMIDSFYMGYSRFMGWDTETVDKFGNITFSWPGLGLLDLQPGFNYTFTASVTIQPVYNVGPMGGANLAYWINSTSTSFAKTATDPNSNQAACRLILTFNRDAAVLYNSTIFTFTDFISSVGSAVALLSIGLTLLGVWQNITGVYPDEEEEAPPTAPLNVPLPDSTSTNSNPSS